MTRYDFFSIAANTKSGCIVNDAYVQAINAVKKVLVATSVDPSRTASLSELKGMGSVFACFSCEAAIVMGFEAIVCRPLVQRLFP